MLALKKKAHTYTKHNYVLSHFKICYLKHSTKHIFYIMNTLTHVFTTLFKLQFSHYFEQQYLKSPTKQALSIFIASFQSEALFFYLNIPKKLLPNFQITYQMVKFPGQDKTSWVHQSIAFFTILHLSTKPGTWSHIFSNLDKIYLFASHHNPATWPDIDHSNKLYIKSGLTFLPQHRERNICLSRLLSHVHKPPFNGKSSNSRSLNRSKSYP